jgi:hypothetical protein
MIEAGLSGGVEASEGARRVLRELRDGARVPDEELQRAAPGRGVELQLAGLAPDGALLREAEVPVVGLPFVVPEQAGALPRAVGAPGAAAFPVGVEERAVRDLAGRRAD